jgi:hypothetical protein
MGKVAGSINVRQMTVWNAIANEFSQDIKPAKEMYGGLFLL